MLDPSIALRQVLTVIADGEVHRQTDLMQTLHLSENEVSSLLKLLSDSGVDLKFQGTAVQWVNPKPLLTRNDVMMAMDENFRARIAKLSIKLMCDSTNRVVSDLGMPDSGQLHVAISEFQTSGRGRRGGEWDSPLASGFCLTLSLSLPLTTRLSGALTLAIGLAVSDALEPWLKQSILLKWPNDLILNDGKLGGILTTVSERVDDGYLLVVGIGINFDAVEDLPIQLDKHAIPPVGLHNFLRKPVTRAQIAAAVIQQVTPAVELYQEHGFAPIRERWNHRDYLAQARVQVSENDRITNGVAAGVDDNGALIVDVDGTRKFLYGGEVRVRRQ